MKLLILLLTLISCTLTNMSKVPLFETINSLWSRSVNLEDVLQKLGKPGKDKNKELIYYFENSKIPKIVLSFDDKSNLEKAFMFLEAGQIEEFKNIIKCDWNEVTGKTQIKDLITKSHEGRCVQLPIRFKYSSSMNSYEIWWEDKKATYK